MVKEKLCDGPEAMLNGLPVNRVMGFDNAHLSRNLALNPLPRLPLVTPKGKPPPRRGLPEN